MVGERSDAGAEECRLFLRFFRVNGCECPKYCLASRISLQLAMKDGLRDTERSERYGGVEDQTRLNVAASDLKCGNFALVHN